MNIFKISSPIYTKAAIWFTLCLCLGTIVSVAIVRPVHAQATICSAGQIANPSPPPACITAPQTDATCKASRSYRFLGILPVWYEYIQDYKKIPVTSQLGTDTCGIVHAPGTDAGENVKKDAIAIGLAIIDILLRLGAIVAVVFIMMGGYKYISSQGEPKNIEAAMATIVNAAIGLGIVVSATVLVAFIGNTLGGG